MSKATFVGSVSSCGHAIVVSSDVAITRSLVGEDCVPLLRPVAGGRSIVVTRRALVRRRLRVVIIRSIVGVSVRTIAGLRSLVVTRRALVRRLLGVAILRSIVSEDCVPSFCVVAG